MTETLRLIIDPPLSGVENMARDEALLEGIAQRTSPPTLRFYAWREPTISLGYFQRYAEFQAQDDAVRTLAVVRRTTGGGAILHDLELTYSIAIPADSEWVHPNANKLYHLAHRAIIAAVGSAARMVLCTELAGAACGEAPRSVSESQRNGPFFCFARRHPLDVLVSPGSAVPAGEKLAGSAQRRTRQAVLQHGSIMLSAREPRQPGATWRELGGPGDFQPAVERLAGPFSTVFSVLLEPGGWNRVEADATAALAEKYGSAQWTHGVAPSVPA